MRTPPPFIEQAGVIGLPKTFPWEGEGMHSGPSQGTKLHDALDKLSVCSLVTLSILVEEWMIWRLGDAVDQQRYLHLADATLAWQVDRRYRDISSVEGSIPSDTPINQALGDAILCIRVASDDEVWDYPTVHVPQASALIHIVKQTLPAKQKKVFEAWLGEALARGAKFAPAPKKSRPKHRDYRGDDAGFRAALRPYFNQALPREALDPAYKYKPEQREPLLSAFLKGLDWKANPFLRSPKQMKALGFEGTPYEL